MKIDILLSRASLDSTSVAWSTMDGTALSGIDYIEDGGVIQFAPGETKKSIEVDIIERTTSNKRKFFIVLDQPVNAVISDDTGVCELAPVVVNGPLVKSSLITNAYNNQLGRGGYFHSNSGTSEGQSVAIEGALRADRVLSGGNTDEKAAAEYFRMLGISLMYGIGSGSRNGPILRQAFPTDVNTITLLHWLFAAKGDIPAQQATYDYVGVPVSKKITIPRADIFNVWKIYPVDAYLLYESPFSPAYDSAGNQVDVPIAQWKVVNGQTVITVPDTAPNLSQWKVVFGYEQGIIRQGEGFEAYPFWTPIADGYAACAPDTFRWLDIALTEGMKVIADNRWNVLRSALRKSAVRGQDITDLREVLKPLANVPVFPPEGQQPDGMFCYSTHEKAVSGQGGAGANFWSRDGAGNIRGVIPTATAVSQTQIGRGFNDEWRTATSYQDADNYLWLSLSCSQLLSGGNILVYVSSTKNYDASKRWYADLKTIAGWANVVAAFNAGTQVDLYIPRTAFTRKDSDNAALPAGTKFENFGVTVDHPGGFTLVIGNMRMVKDTTDQRSAKMPYFPGSMPFAINADTVAQQFVGWNGSPFHGYQLPDYWFILGAEADAVHPNLKLSDLTVADPATGVISSPITATSSDGYAKPKAALLMEQQLYFLKHAQQRWQIDGGQFGPFAHTFVLNTPARMSLGNPTPHTWVYTNDDPNTRWAGYQARVVESLARLTWITRFGPGWKTSRDMAGQMAADWLSWLNTFWPNMNAAVHGMPTDFPDPRISPPQTLYEDPHSPAIVLRACIWMKLSGYGDGTVLDALIMRCWDYIESCWVTQGPMRYTWSPNPDAGEWFGFWHFEIVTTISVMLDEGKAVRPASITDAVLRERLLLTAQWLRETGVE